MSPARLAVSDRPSPIGNLAPYAALYRLLPATPFTHCRGPRSFGGKNFPCQCRHARYMPPCAACSHAARRFRGPSIGAPTCPPKPRRRRISDPASPLGPSTIPDLPRPLGNLVSAMCRHMPPSAENFAITQDTAEVSPASWLFPISPRRSETSRLMPPFVASRMKSFVWRVDL